MFRFDPTDPFPLATVTRTNYADAQNHSAQVDQWLGIQTEKTESGLLQNHRNGQKASDEVTKQWIGLPIQILLTPYIELRAILNELAPSIGNTLIDLGAGYGRMAFVAAAHYPGVSFQGFEIVRERVNEFNRCFKQWSVNRSIESSIEVLHCDLSATDFQLPQADFYFLYDFSDTRSIQKTLSDLRAISMLRRITVIGRGRRSRDLIERSEPWLSQIVQPMHRDHYSIYRTS